MQQNEARKRRQKKEAARRARNRKRRIARISYSATGVVLIAVIVFFLMPFFQRVPAAPASDSVAPPKAATVNPTPAATMAAAEPQPTPDPTPQPTPAPTPYAFETASRKINPKKKMIALTFDDGPNATTTGKLLDILKKNNAKATFFMLGSRAIANPELVARVSSEGHQIGSHTYDHKSLPKLTPDEMLEEISKSIWAISEAGGGKPTILRPPYGNTDEIVCDTIIMPMINWSVDTLDWESRNTKKIYNHLIHDIKDGDIVLMHDLYSTTIAAVKKALPLLKKKGYQFVTVDELFESRGEPLHFGRVYYSCLP